MAVTRYHWRMPPKPAVTENAKVSPILRFILALTVLILVTAGAGLFFAPESTRGIWPWDIGPFNEAFLGGFYLASAAGITLATYYGRWFPTRLILPMMFAFTGTLLLVTGIGFQRFLFDRWATWVWVAIFIGLPLTAGIGMWRYREWPSPTAYVSRPGWRRRLLTVAAFFGTYGIAMFLFPTFIGAHWPWPMDAFHGRAYSAIFTAVAIGAFGLVPWSAPTERLTLGVAYTALGLFSVFGVVIVDASRHTVPWGNPGVWVWGAMFAFLFWIGLGLIWWSSSGRDLPGEVPPPRGLRSKPKAKPDDAQPKRDTKEKK
jgi:hypothetical protein